MAKGRDRVIVSTTYKGIVVEIVEGDLLQLEATCVVNSTSEDFQGGTGLDGDIHAAAGPDLKAELTANYPKGGKIGDAYPSGSFNLGPDIKHIIHAIGPDFRELGDPPTKRQITKVNKLLRAAYLAALDACYFEKEIRENDMTIGLPSIATGLYEFPQPQAARIALTAIRDAVDSFVRLEFPDSLPARISVVLLRGADDSADPNEEAYVNLFDTIFPKETKKAAPKDGAKGKPDNPRYNLRSGKKVVGKKKAVKVVAKPPAKPKKIEKPKTVEDVPDPGNASDTGDASDPGYVSDPGDASDLENLVGSDDSSENASNSDETHDPRDPEDPEATSDQGNTSDSGDASDSGDSSDLEDIFNPNDSSEDASNPDDVHDPNETPEGATPEPERPVTPAAAANPPVETPRQKQYREGLALKEAFEKELHEMKKRDAVQENEMKEIREKRHGQLKTLGSAQEAQKEAMREKHRRLSGLKEPKEAHGKAVASEGVKRKALGSAEPEGGCKRKK